MTTQVNVYEAKTHLSRLLDRVTAGEDIVIAKAGRPVARLVPVSSGAEPRKLGAWKGQIWMAPDFDETPPELLAAFENGDEDDDW